MDTGHFARGGGYPLRRGGRPMSESDSDVSRGISMRRVCRILDFFPWPAAGSRGSHRRIATGDEVLGERIQRLIAVHPIQGAPEPILLTDDGAIATPRPVAPPDGGPRQ
jgi:hypothetical protein